MIQNPKISVLMSTYKEKPRFVKESINSILAQTFKNFELIIINDYPEDVAIDRMVKSYNDNRIRYYRNKNNIGLALSMNFAASVARSHILARMDADDIAMPQRFEKQIDILENKQFDFICGNYDSIDEEGNIKNTRKVYKFPEDKNISKNVQVNPAIIHHPTVMFKRSYFDQVGGYRNFPCAQDLDLWMRMSEIGCKIAYVPDILIKYRINSNSISKQKHFQQQLTIHYSYKLSIQRILKGKDSYSLSSYSDYLKKHGMGDTRREIRFEELHRSLGMEIKSNKFLRIIKKLANRVNVFLNDSSLRGYYVNKLKKRVLLKYL